MKQLTLLFAAMAVFFTSLNAQVMEDFRVMALGNQNAIVIDIPDASSSFVEKQWKSYMKQYGKVKRVKKSKEWIVDDAQILNIGGTQLVDLYGRAEEGGGASKMVLWVDLDGQFISSDSAPDAYAGSVQLLENFAHSVKVELVSIELEDQIKAMDKLESKMKKLRKDNDGYHKTIEQAKERIAKAEQDIEKNLEDQELTSQEIETQGRLVEDVRERLNAIRAERSGGS